MGLVVSKLKYKDFINDVSFKIGKNNILGIYGNESKYLLDILNGDIQEYSGTINFDKDDLDTLFYKSNPCKIVKIAAIPKFYSNNVEEEFKFCFDYRKYTGDQTKAIKDALKLFEFDEKILKRNISTLSRSEKYLINLAINLSINPDLILIENIFSGMDHNNIKRIKTILNNLKENKKLIIITSNNTNILYDITDEVILLDKGTVYKTGLTEKVFTSNELMKGEIVPMPSITKVTYLAKSKKNVKLSYFKDVRDIIKDIYKHV